jgi:predicted nucleotidyltransferase
MVLDEALTLLRAHLAELQELGIGSLSLFGSVVRDEAGAESDVDLLIEFSKPVGLFEFLDAKSYLEAILGASVDLVTEDALKPQLRDEILAEAVRVA